MDRLPPASGLHSNTHSVQRLLHQSRDIMRLEELPEESICDILLAINGILSEKKQNNRAYLLKRIDRPGPSSSILHYQQEMIDLLECARPITI